jgi:hypothetical protein
MSCSGEHTEIYWRPMNPLKQLATELERLEIAYLVGGSHASSARGVGRPTMDTDLVAAIDPSKIGALSSALGAGWYADSAQMADAISRGRSFNLIHMLTAERFDIFPVTNEFHVTQLQRATRETLEVAGEAVECPVATAEDILLAKLQRYRSGGEVSERQWDDIMGIIRLNPSLDLVYVRLWAPRLNVTDLLERALRGQRGGAQ